jgi:hypothetical protein
MYIIVDADVNVQLKVKSRAPCSLTFPKLLLNIPILYRTQDEHVFATETLISEVTQDVVFLPTKRYAKLTALMKQFITDTSILLDFTSEMLQQLSQSPMDPFTIEDIDTTMVFNNKQNTDYYLLFNKDGYEHNGYHYSTIDSLNGNYFGLNTIL